MGQQDDLKETGTGSESPLEMMMIQLIVSTCYSSTQITLLY